MKKLWITILLMLLCSSAAAEEIRSGDYTYTLDASGYATLTDWRWEEIATVPDTLYLPAELDGHPVVALGDASLYTDGIGRDGLTIVVPEGVRRLEGEPFLCCHQVDWILLPSTLEEIGEGLSTHVDADVIVAPDNPNYTVQDGFLIDTRTSTLLYCAYSVGATPLPAVRRIGDGALVNWGWAFYGGFLSDWPEDGAGLTLTIPEGVESIGTHVIFDNVVISRLVLPDSLTEMAPMAFYCASLTEVKFGSGLTSLPEGAFMACQIDEEKVVLPESITFIGCDAFDDVGLVTTLNPDCHRETPAEYLTRMGDAADPLIGFWNEQTCGPYTYILDEYGGAIITAWEEDPVPAVVEVPATLDGFPVRKLAEGVFCTEYVEVPEPFRLIIPEGVTACVGDPFVACGAREIVLPSTILSIPEGCCEMSYAKIAMSPDNPEYTVRDGCLINKSTGTLRYRDGFSGETPIPAVRRIGEGALRNWGYVWSEADGRALPSLQEGTLIIPEGVESIGAYAVFDNPNVRHLILPDTLTILEPLAFFACDLEDVTFGEGLTYIPEGCFAGTNLTAVTLPESITFVGWGAFDEAVAVTALNPDCHFETEEEHDVRHGAYKHW